MLLTNGRIYTLDGRDAVVDTVVVRDGRIAFTGRRADVNAGPGEETIDLQGRAVLPGLVDAHGHLMHLARARLSFDARGLGSEEEIARRIGERASTRPRGDWITGRNWDQNLWPGRQFPSKATLDATAPAHPVALVRIDGHATWANSAALAAGGIDRATPDPPGGLIARDARGEPTGLLIDTAQRLLQTVEPRPTDAQFDQAVRECIADCLAVGLTGIHEMGAELYALAAYRRLSERGDFPFRNYVAVAGRSTSTWDHYRQRGPEAFGDGRVTVGALKLLADGALGSGGGAAPHASP
jgi:predicted amidohydrolase YtcJ